MLNGAVRNIVVVVLLGLGLASAAAISMSRSDYRVGFDSVLAIWADFARDADRIGLVVTRLSTQEETSIGDAIVAEFYPRGLDTDPGLTAYVSAVGERLVEAGGLHRKDVVYKFHVLDTTYANAWALPGGHVFVTTGLVAMMESEAQLASILGHEIAHVDLRHVVERLQYEITLRRIVGDLGAIVRLGYGLVNVSYSTQQESEADRAGLLAMAEAGYSPLEAIEMFAAVQQAGLGGATTPAKASGPVTEVLVGVSDMLRDYFATHPATGDRIVALTQLMADNRPAWKDRLFCVGRTNFADRVTCADGHRDSEWQPLDLDSPAYHLRLAMLVDASGYAALADRELSTVLAAAPDYPATIRARAATEGDDLPAALQDLRGAILLQSAQVRLKAGAGDIAAMRAKLGQDLVLHAALVSTLGRIDHVTVPPSTADFSSVPFGLLCRAVLSADATMWRPDPRLSELVLEAKDRSYTPLDCRIGSGQLPDRGISASRPFHNLLGGAP
ncbi:M48 family metalloprotease [Devosia sp.]|uniref:M48 family metalloprotease n=1 Tax=Devosia sp. TaxID=1871048 RepID=UPI001AD01211|nr:M48 family metalloprotease [Devosia sp.]MBN9310947.1 M48 family metalloprotease [Devosia sp.]